MSSNKKCTIPIVRDAPPARTVSFNEVSAEKEGARVSLSVEELALLNEIQRRGRANSSTVSYFEMNKWQKRIKYHIGTAEVQKTAVIQLHHCFTNPIWIGL